MSDHWRSLAEDIGAEVTEPEEKPDPAAEKADESPPPPQPAQAPRKRVPPKPKNHWQKIAGALGISFDKSESEEESTDTEKPVAAESQVTEPAVLDPAVSDTATGDTLTGDTEPAVPSSDLIQDEVTKERHSTFGFDEKSSSFDAPVDDRSDGVDRSDHQESGDTRDQEVDTVRSSTPSSDDESTQAYDPEHAKRELAALFAEPVDTSAPAADIGFSGDTVVPSDDQANSFSALDEATQIDELPEINPQGEIDKGQDDKSDARRPRRRRGSRRRRKDDQPASTRSEPELSTSVDADENENLTETTAADADDSLPSEKESEIGSDESRAPRGHRKIPSWQDAVGAIVDANLESRNNNPSSGSNQGGRRRRGSGRGRGRPPQQR
jgi:hypothetical protein